MPGNDFQDEETYTAAQAAKVLSISRRHVLNLLRENELEGFRETEGSAWKIFKWSVHSLRDRRPATQRAPEGTERPVEASDARDRVETLARELGRLEGRLELTEIARSTLEEQLARERERADKAEEELREERSKGFWRRMFGG